MRRQIQLYRNLFSKSFFFDKYSLKNVYQYPTIGVLKLKFLSSPKLVTNKVNLCKVVLLFYLLTGQKSKLLVKNCNLRNIKRKKILGLFLTIHQYEYFFDFLIRRQFALVSLFFQPLSIQQGSTFAFNITQKTYDDDILFQALKVAGNIRYQVCLKSNSLQRSYFQSLLISFKIPFKN